MLMGRAGCLMLLCGIPCSGKTTFARELCQDTLSSRDTPQFFVLPLHTDEFYPLDLRSRRIQDVEHFDMKAARRNIVDCLKYLLCINGVGSCEVLEPSQPPILWKTFSRWLWDHELADETGKFVSAKDVLIIVDENLHLRSMRREYYQVARDCRLGFTEVFLQCSLVTALTRNAQRPVPLLPSTIARLEQTMEWPHTEKNQWESRNITCSTECSKEFFLTDAIAKVYLLVMEAFNDPVQPLPCDETEKKVLARTVNLHSYIHQADNILRKCVSEGMKNQSDGHKGSNKAVAEKLNSLRKEILEEVKSGHVSENCFCFEADSPEFKRTIEELFVMKLNK